MLPVQLPWEPFLASFGLALLLTPVARAVGRRYGFVAQPKADRWHRQPTALLGGVAVYVTTLVIALLLGTGRTHAPVLLGATAIFVVGLIDDMFGLKPGTKLTAQITAASMLVYVVGWMTWTGSHTADAILTILWVVAITNAFNLLDNMDGLCAGIGLIAAGAFIWAAPPEAASSRTIAATLTGALFGFLFYNFNPASIFLGDSGSLFVGFTLAGLTASYGPRPGSSVMSVIAVPVLILLIPILDTTLVTIARKLSGRAASQGGTDHLSHRLVALGFSERSAVLILYALAAMSGATAALVGTYGFANVNLLIAVLLIALLMLGIQLARVRVYEDADFQLLQNRVYTPLLIDLTYKRRVFEILLDFLLISVSYYGAYRLRFEGEEFALQFPNFITSLPVVIGCKTVAFFLSGVYRGVWRYVSLADLTVYMRGVLLGSVASVVAVVYLYRFERFSRGIFIIDALLLLCLLVGTRLSFRTVGELARRHRRPIGPRALIYGAGDAGVLLLRELLNNDGYGYHPIGFLDDDVRKHGRKIHGLSVLGGLGALAPLIVERSIDAVLLSTIKVSGERLARLEQLCHESATPLIVLSVRLRAVDTIKAFDPSADV